MSIKEKLKQFSYYYGLGIILGLSYMSWSQMSTSRDNINYSKFETTKFESSTLASRAPVSKSGSPIIVTVTPNDTSEWPVGEMKTVQVKIEFRTAVADVELIGIEEGIEFLPHLDEALGAKSAGDIIEREVTVTRKSDGLGLGHISVRGMSGEFLIGGVGLISTESFGVNGVHTQMQIQQKKLIEDKKFYQ